VHRLRDKVVAAPRQQEVAACSAAAVCWRPRSCWGYAAAATAAHARFRGALEGCAAGHLLQRPVLGPLLPPASFETLDCLLTTSSNHECALKDGVISRTPNEHSAAHMCPTFAVQVPGTLLNDQDCTSGHDKRPPRCPTCCWGLVLMGRAAPAPTSPTSPCAAP
jgi:hypothetical protein